MVTDTGRAETSPRSPDPPDAGSRTDPFDPRGHAEERGEADETTLQHYKEGEGPYREGGGRSGDTCGIDAERAPGDL